MQAFNNFCIMTFSRLPSVCGPTKCSRFIFSVFLLLHSACLYFGYPIAQRFIIAYESIVGGSMNIWNFEKPTTRTVNADRVSYIKLLLTQNWNNPFYYFCVLHTSEVVFNFHLCTSFFLYSLVQCFSFRYIFYLSTFCFLSKSHFFDHVGSSILQIELRNAIVVQETCFLSRKMFD